MYFKVNNKLIKILSYNNFLKLINSISSDNTYILINNYKHISQINEKNFSNLSNINTITINYKLNGGLSGVIESFMSIYKILLLIPKLIIWFVEFIIWVVRFIVWLIITVFSFFKYGLTNSVNSIIKGIFNATIGLFAKIFNRITGRDIQKNIEEDLKDPKKRCFITDEETLPTTVLVSTILCPPLGVFMVYGLSGWIHILVSAGLSLLYYIPGLVYSLVLFYS